jgi:hypothetical protein
MVLLHLGIYISFRAMYGLALLEIFYLDRFFFHLYLPVTTTQNLWKNNSLYYRKTLLYRYAIKCGSCKMELQHISTALFESV